MFLAVLWAATAAVLGFMAGRVSMYSMYGWKEELAEGAEGAGTGMSVKAAGMRERGTGGFGRMIRCQADETQEKEAPCRGRTEEEPGVGRELEKSRSRGGVGQRFRRGQALLQTRDSQAQRAVKTPGKERLDSGEVRLKSWKNVSPLHDGDVKEDGRQKGWRTTEDFGASPQNVGRLKEGHRAAGDRRVWPAVRPWESGRVRAHKRGGRRSEEEGKTWSLGSPVPGELFLREDEEQIRVVIQPDQDRLYAPADGKITRLFPMGNAFLFTTEFGLELYIQVGEADDELLGRYYRPRVIQNEVVPKGKLLLEFDRQGLWAEGASSEVSLCVENCFYGSDVRATGAEWVAPGEEILRVFAAPEKSVAK